LHGTILVYYERYRRGHKRDHWRIARANDKRVEEKSF
jgi:hypothetical protein